MFSGVKNILKIWGHDAAAESAMCRHHWNAGNGQLLTHAQCYKRDLHFLLCIHHMDEHTLYEGFPEYYQLCLVVFTFNGKRPQSPTTVQLFCPHGIGPDATGTKAAASVFPLLGLWADVREELMALDESAVEDFGIDVCLVILCLI